jgi:flagellar FliL protein
MAAKEAPAEAAPPKKGKKKLIIIIAAAVLLLGGGGAAALVMMKKKAAAAEEGGEGKAAQADAPKFKAPDPKNPPIFVALEPFTVNLKPEPGLGDKFAQISVTLEVAAKEVEDALKLRMPILRNEILFAIADKTAAELLTNEGKQALGMDIASAAGKQLGWQAPPKFVVPPQLMPQPGMTPEQVAQLEQMKSMLEKQHREQFKSGSPNPVLAVHFASFIVH